MKIIIIVSVNELQTMLNFCIFKDLEFVLASMLITNKYKDSVPNNSILVTSKTKPIKTNNNLLGEVSEKIEKKNTVM